MLFSPGATTAALNSFQINIDSLYQSVIDASEIAYTSENFVQMSIPEMPVGRSFQCDVAAVNDYGVRSTTESIPMVTPPPISAGPTVLNIEETDDGVLVYFDPTNYWGTEWFGTVTYVATCDSGSSGANASASSAPVSGSPALIEGLSADSDLDCTVAIDNIYESVTGPVYAYEPETSGGLPIWLLYEASREGRAN